MIQEQVLNKILNDKDASIITLNNLTVDFFSDYKAEFQFIQNHLNTYGNIPDKETFLNTFTEFQLLEVNESVNYLLDELNKDRNKRFLAENFNKIRNYIMEDNVEDALQLLREAANNSNQSISLQCTNILKDTTRYDRYLDRMNNFDKYFTSTGFPELDDIIGGWDCNEDLATIVARPGMGKSWILFKCASAAALVGRRVGIYSGEMSEDSVGYRVDTLIGHINNGALMHGGHSVKNEYKNFLDSLSQIPGEIFILTPKQLNGPATPSALRAFVEKYDLDILFVDQHSLLQDDKKAKNPVEKAANISTDLKMLQAVKRIPVICVSQQNRQKLEDSSFDTTQISSADKIGQDSSVVIFIERSGEDLMKLHLVKLRNAPAGTVLTYRIDLNRGQFYYIPKEDECNEESSSSENIMSGYSEDEVF